MAGQEHQIDIGDDDLLPPWSTVFEVVNVTDVNEWVLVGGLMVQLHAYRAQIPPPRLTKDVDMVVNVAADSVSVAGIAGALTRIGFDPLVPDRKSSPVYRFTRDKEQVDVMVADHLPSRFRPRFMMRPAFSVPAGEQAIRRRDTFVVTSAMGAVTLGSPDVLGALIAKGAANIADQRDPERHIEDAAVLLASIEAVGDLDFSDTSKNDRKRLSRIATKLSSVDAAAWIVLDDSNRRRGQQNLARLVSAARLVVPTNERG